MRGHSEHVVDGCHDSDEVEDVFCFLFATDCRTATVFESPEETVNAVAMTITCFAAIFFDQTTGIWFAAHSQFQSASMISNRPGVIRGVGLHSGLQRSRVSGLVVDTCRTQKTSVYPKLSPRNVSTFPGGQFD